MNEFLKEHYEKLNKALNEIYTVNTPYDYPISTEPQINVDKELAKLRALEKFYSAIEKGKNQGSIYEEYNGHLQYAKMAIEVLEREKQAIEEAHADNIANIRLLLEGIEEEQ